MKTKAGMTLALIVGAIAGASATSVLHAQSKAPVYLVSEITVSNAAAYGKEYSPKVQASVAKHGGKIIALGGSGGGGAQTLKGLQGDPPQRAALQEWPSMEALNAWWNSEDYKEARAIGDKYAKFRIYTVDGANLTK